MNCPSRVDETLFHEGWNQNPQALAADLTTRQDLNGIANARLQRDHSNGEHGHPGDVHQMDELGINTQEPNNGHADSNTVVADGNGIATKKPSEEAAAAAAPKAPLAAGPAGSEKSTPPPDGPGKAVKLQKWAKSLGQGLLKYIKFIGPGFMVSVAYIDPGNYSTDVAAGATFRFRLLFIILMANLFAIFLQSLCIKLGTVTGLNLAEHCRAHLPKWLNITLYVLGESAIIATDIAEVIGSAIALNLLLRIPLVAGCALTLVDVLVILLFYHPTGSLKRLRAFERFVIALVLGVVIAFCVQLSYIRDTDIGEVFRGYLPSSTVVRSQGLYLSCGILGATVMPHSLYLGSGIVQARLMHFDSRLGGTPTDHQDADDDDDTPKYRPSLMAIRFCLKYSIAEVAISLFTFALFVNSSILIVAGASLSGEDAAEDADLFEVHHLLSRTLAPVAGTIFALALLLSGTSAGIVCTIAGQMLSEGALRWTVAPWMRRLITRGISIIPSVIIAASVGRKGLSTALTATQVVLSVLLPFISAPIIYFTCRNRYMTVPASGEHGPVSMRNHWFTAILALAIWLIITVMNVALLVLLGLGKA
ncbi:MAG: hypothetical protein M1823_003548 [Watsoniomyces obsoletus]|nr:MAG: hypothetical protein M1823_003548 [Watsoniomyces obsoletus]